MTPRPLRSRIARSAALAALLFLVALGTLPLARCAVRPLPTAWRGRQASALAPAAGPLVAGAARVAIAVEAGGPLAGFPGRRQAEGEGDPIFARALVLEQGAVRVVLVSLEGLLVSGDLEEQVIERAGLAPTACLVLAATHSHSGPGGTWDNPLAAVLGNGGYDLDRRRAVAQAAADAIRAAVAALRPARLRWTLEDWTAGPARPRSGAAVSPRFLALAVDGDDGAPLATVVDYGMHATVLGRRSHRLSGDWPGFAAAALESATGGAPALFFQGAVGNATFARAGLPSEPVAAARALGAAVGGHALESRATAEAHAPALACATRLVALPAPQASAAIPWPVRRATGNLLALWSDPAAVRTTVSLGGLVLEGVPGEPVAALAPRDDRVLIGLADGYVGYLEQPAAVETGTGEAMRTYYGPVLARALGL